MRNGDLKHRLCEIDSDGRMLHVDSSLPWPPRGRFTVGTMMPHGRRSPFHRSQTLAPPPVTAFFQRLQRGVGRSSSGMRGRQSTRTGYLTIFNPVGAASETVNATGLLARPLTVTTTFPVVAPSGTGTKMLVADQVVGVAATPLNVTVLVPLVAPKPVPAIVTAVATDPVVGERLA